MSQILLIDSDPAAAAAIEADLVAAGIAVRLTADGNEGLELARQQAPDVLILCVELRGISGYSVCNKLKKDSVLSTIPLVLVSSQATEETFEQHRKLKTRAEAYLRRPYEMAALRQILATWLPQLVVATEIVAPAGERTAALGLDIELDLELGTSPVASHPVPQDDLMIDLDFTAPPAAAAVPAAAVAAAVAPAARAPTPVAIRAHAPLAAVRHAVSPPVAPEPADLDLDLELGLSPSVRPAPQPTVASEAETAVGPNPLSAAPPRRSGVPAGSAMAAGAAAANQQEMRQLRQKVADLEQTLQQKEMEFNDRLLQESARGRETLDLKKKMTQLERELKVQLQQVEEGRKNLEAGETQRAILQSEKQALQMEQSQLQTAALAQQETLLASQLASQNEIATLQAAQAGSQQSLATAQQSREKAKKAVDIALQLLDEAGPERPAQ